MTMSEPPSNGGGLNPDQELMLWPAGSPASRLATRVDAWRKPIPGGSGRRCSTSSKESDRPGSSERMCPVCAHEALPLSSETFGALDTGSVQDQSQPVPWVRHTHASVCSSWPTPKAKDGARGGMSEAALLRRLSNTRRGVDLGDAIGGPPNPEWVEWLMGFPQGWTDVEPSVTP